MTQIFPKSRAAGPEKPEVYLAAFGKHPGWNDHIDDLGLETQQLVAFKRVLYLDGISGAIESGAWDKLEPDRRIDGFGHVIVSRAGGAWLAARLWSSSDGKGRTKYPMVVCIEARGVGFDWVLNTALPTLERLQTRCTDTTMASVVTTIMDSARAELRASLPARIEPASGVDPKIIAQLADDPALGGGPSNREGFYRLFYQIERDWSAFVPAPGSTAAGKSSRTIDVRAQHARVPACGATAQESIRRWMPFLIRTVHPSTTATVVAALTRGPAEERWADLIVGDPSGSNYFCLRASPRAMPPVTDVPYTIDETFVRRCDDRVERSRRGDDEAPASAVLTPARGPGLLSRLFGSKRLMIVLIVAVVLIGAGAGILLMLSAKGSNPGGTGPPAASGTGSGTPHDSPPDTPAVDPAAPRKNASAPDKPMSSDADIAAWQRLCDEFDGWALMFLQKLDERPRGGATASRRDTFLSDAYLSNELRPLLNAMRDGIAMDPRSIAGVARDERYAAIRRDPPASAMTPSAKERTAEALRVVESVRTALSAERWPALSDLRELERRLRQVERTRDADVVGTLVRGATIDESKDLAGGIDRVLSAQTPAASLRRSLKVLDDASAAADSVADPELSRLRAWVSQQIAAIPPAPPETGAGGAAAVLQALDASIAAIAHDVGPIATFLQSNGSNIDQALLASRRGADAAAAPLSAHSLRAWLDDAALSLKLSPDSDPRRSWDAPRLLDGVAATRGRLESELKVPLAPELTAEQARLADRLNELKSIAWNAGTKAQLEAAIPALEASLRALSQRLDNAFASERIRLQGSAADVRAQLQAQRTIVSRGEAVNDAWREERDSLMARYSDAQYPQLALEAGTLRERLVAFDDAVPAPLALPAAGRRWASALNDASAAAREEAIRDALGSWRGAGGFAGDADGTKLSAAQHAVSSAVQGWLREATSLAGDAERAEGLLDQGYSLSEQSPNGSTIASIVASWKSSKLVQTESVAAAIAPIRDRAQALTQIEQTTDRLRLLSIISTTQPETPERLIGAWRQLDRVDPPGWPASLVQLEEERSLEAAVSQAMSDVRPGDRSEQLKAELEIARHARWQRCFSLLTQAAEIEAAAALAPAMGVDPSALPDRLKFNYDLAILKQSLGGEVRADQQVVELAAKVAASIRSLDPRVAESPAGAALLAALADIADQTPAPVPSVDVTRLGPGSIGWAGRVDGDVIEFSRGSSVLRFVRVQPAQGPTTYVGQAEVSLAQVIDIVESSGTWSDFRTFFRDEETGDARYGPRVWRWSSRQRSSAKLRVSDRWQQEVFRLRSPPADSPADLGVAPPSADCPMNYISPGGAAYVAALAGSRLPTPAEWQAARAKAAESALSSANLRDQTWKSQQEYVRRVRDSSGNVVPPEVQWPDAGIFRGGPESPRGADATAGTTKDGTLWFGPASAGAAQTPGIATNLIGNVAEYVMDAPPPVFGDAPGSRPDARALREYVDRHAKETFVIGGSALSPPSVPVDQPLALVEPDELTNGYSDVGFRLAFTAEGAAPAPEPLFSRFARVIAEARYIEPK
ncbi:MAG: hypothetical protein AB7O77_16015 [Phycisphaerales bacterium]